MTVSAELLTSLGGVCDSIDGDGYDEIVVSQGHRSRLAGMVIRGGVDFGGITMTGHDHIPEGIGVMRRAGQVVGIMDFKAQKVVLLGKAKT